MLFSGVLSMKVNITKVFKHLGNGKEVLVDSGKLQEIYNRYFDTIYRICFLYMKNEADTLDAVQETFLRLMQSGFMEYSEEKTKAWLIVTASNYCKKQLGHWWRRKREVFEETVLENATEQTLHPVVEAVQDLPKKYRILIYLYYYEGYKTGEIGSMLGISASTVQTRLAKARKLLKLEIEGIGEDYDEKGISGWHEFHSSGL